MSRLFALLTVGIFLLGLPQIGSAQVSNLALGQAKARLACGAGIVVSAVFLPNGSLQVTCARNPVESSASSTTTAASVAETTGLAAPTGIGTVISVSIIGTIVGGASSTTTNENGGGSP